MPKLNMTLNQKMKWKKKKKKLKFLNTNMISDMKSPTELNSLPMKELLKIQQGKVKAPEQKKGNKNEKKNKTKRFKWKKMLRDLKI